MATQPQNHFDLHICDVGPGHQRIWKLFTVHCLLKLSKREVRVERRNYF